VALRRLVAGLVAALVLGVGPDARAQSLTDFRSFEVTAAPAKATVGDSIVLAFRLHLNDRDLLTDTVPAPAGELPAGVRVLSVERLQRGADRAFTGRAVIALYRPGVQDLPTFAVPWVQVVTGHRGLVITTGPATVEIVPVLPAGNPTLRDIREPEPPRGPGPVPLAAAGAVAATVLVWAILRRRPRNTIASVVAPAPEPAIAPGPWEEALARLDRLARERPEGREATAAWYAAAADVLREYLESAEALPARERTTSELLWALPPRLGEGGLRRRLQELLWRADLVKFARVRPGAEDGAGFLADARELVTRWHQTAAEPAGAADAVR
jgi:hypothetical protein